MHRYEVFRHTKTDGDGDCNLGRLEAVFEQYLSWLSSPAAASGNNASWCHREALVRQASEAGAAATLAACESPNWPRSIRNAIGRELLSKLVFRCEKSVTRGNGSINLRRR